MDDRLYLLLSVKTLLLRGQKEMFSVLWAQVLVREGLEQESHIMC